MSDLTDAIAAFLEKYPADARMEWQGKPPRIGPESDPNATVAWAATLTNASQRHNSHNGVTP